MIQLKLSIIWTAIILVENYYQLRADSSDPAGFYHNYDRKSQELYNKQISNRKQENPIYPNGRHKQYDTVQNIEQYLNDEQSKYPAESIISKNSPNFENNHQTNVAKNNGIIYFIIYNKTQSSFDSYPPSREYLPPSREDLPHAPVPSVNCTAELTIKDVAINITLTSTISTEVEMPTTYSTAETTKISVNPENESSDSGDLTSTFEDNNNTQAAADMEAMNNSSSTSASITFENEGNITSTSGDSNNVPISEDMKATIITSENEENITSTSGDSNNVPIAPNMEAINNSSSTSLSTTSGIEGNVTSTSGDSNNVPIAEDMQATIITSENEGNITSTSGDSNNSGLEETTTSNVTTPNIITSKFEVNVSISEMDKITQPEDKNCSVCENSKNSVEKCQKVVVHHYHHIYHHYRYDFPHIDYYHHCEESNPSSTTMTPCNRISKQNQHDGMHKFYDYPEYYSPIPFPYSHYKGFINPVASDD